MEVTEIRVALRPSTRPSASLRTVPSEVEGRPSTLRQQTGREGGEQRLKAYATITFDHCFVVRNIKVIEGRNGLFVAMPSHKAKTACARCAFKNDMGGRFCVQCGSRLAPPPPRLPPGAGETEGPEAAAHRDIAHPITVQFRQYLQQRILEAFDAERVKASSAAAVT